MSSEWMEMCEMFGQDPGDDEAVDNILEAIHDPDNTEVEDITDIFDDIPF